MATGIVGLTQSWAPLCTDATVTDNSGSAIVAPLSIARTAQNWGYFQHYTPTNLLLCVQYTQAKTVSVSPVIQVFGQDPNGIPQALADNASSPSYAPTLTCTNATDVQGSGGFAYSPILTFPLLGAQKVLAAIQTACSIASGGTAVIMAKVV